MIQQRSGDFTEEVRGFGMTMVEYAVGAPCTVHSTIIIPESANLLRKATAPVLDRSVAFAWSIRSWNTDMPDPGGTCLLYTSDAADE